MNQADVDVVLSNADQRYVATHQGAASLAYEAAAEMTDSADGYFRDGDWELAAQAEEDALGFEQQAEDEFERVAERRRRAEREQLTRTTR